MIAQAGCENEPLCRWEGDESSGRSMRDVDGRGQRLADFLEQVFVPRLGGVERLAAFDARKFDGTEFVPPFLVLSDQAAFALLGAFDGLEYALIDELEIFIIRRSRTGK